MTTTDTTGRLLALLSALQDGGAVSGTELADRLGVTARTVRRDVERLRELGYAVEGRRGASGRYSLGSWGSALPPLILDREEAIALAVCVRSAAGESVSGVADAAARALRKLQQSLPRSARLEAGAIASSTVRVPSAGEEVDHAILLTLSAACHTPERLRMRYRSAVGDETERRVEPYRVVSVDRRWYLVAFDLDRSAWRTFRLDRVLHAEGTGHGITFSDPPDPADYVRESLALAPYRFHADVVVHAPIAEVSRRTPPRFAMLEELGPTSTRLRAGADDLEYLVVRLGSFGLPFTVETPDELRRAMVAVGRLMVAAGTAAADAT